jgi:transcriptional regulator with XRE-family HTH domain
VDAVGVQWGIAVAVIERQRILHGFTRDALARAARVDPKTVRDALNGRRHPTLGTVDRLARALDVTLADVLIIEERHPAPAPDPVRSPIRAAEQLRLVN